MPVASEFCNSKSGVNSVISLTSSSDCADSESSSSTGPDSCVRDKQAKCQGPSHQSNVPARSLIPVRQNQLEPQQAQRTASAEKAQAHKLESAVLQCHGYINYTDVE